MKKNVTLDVFEESVLPMLQQKHKKIEDLQKAIDTEYFIFEDGDEGKKTQVKYTVSKPAKAVEEDEDAPSIKELIAESVKAAVDEIKKANPGFNGPAGGEVNKKFTVPAECKRFGKLKAFTNKSVSGNDYAPDERAFRFGMWGLAAKGNRVAADWCNDHGIGLQEKKFSDDLLQKLHSEGTNTAGGYLVPEEFGADLILLREQYGVARHLPTSFRWRRILAPIRARPVA
jgi:HK97 family phage major capsid protein